MSRALEKEVASLLKTSNHRPAYKEISQALVASDPQVLLELEILGHSHPLPAGTSLLRDGSAIAVSKLALVGAFLVARQALERYLGGDTGTSSDDVLAATAVLLLLDPEHLTAANTRKRILKSLKNVPPDVLRLALQREKHLVDSFLTSRLHRHTKSPTLWSHRRWLLTMFTAADLKIPVLDDLVRVVGVAGERHPRNYYAWTHARRLANIMPSGNARRDSQKAVLDAAKDWAFKHHTDVSGWSFLYSLLNAEGLERAESASGPSTIFTETLNLAVSLQWTNESVWTFLRTVAASGLVGRNEHDEFRRACSALKSTVSEKSPEQEVLGNAETWCETYRVQKR